MRKPIALAIIAPLLLAPVMAQPASAQSVVHERKLQKDIKRGLKELGYKQVTVKCPKDVIWKRGKQFTCKITSDQGKGKVRVTLRSGATKGNAVWVVVP